MNSFYTDLRSRYERKLEGYYSLKRQEMVDFVPADARTILDVGCGEGGFGSAVKTKFPGVEIWGIEPDMQSAEKAENSLDGVINAPFGNELDLLQGKKFDCIVFNDVLEHLPNPEIALQHSKKYLNPSGIILASIPNILYYPVIREVLVTQDWRYQDHGTLDNTHLRFYTRKSIVRLFQENGYEVCTVKGINPGPCGKLYRLLNAVLFKRLYDWRYLQFAVIAKPKMSS